MSGEALKGHLELLLLAVLQPRPAHGYAIIEELRRRSGGTFDLPEGTVYPALHRLERDGLLASRWSEATGRRRRVYDLTEKGRAEFTARQREWRDFSQSVDAVLREAQAPEAVLQGVGGHARFD
jgi:DNA-binding PadR family transcriptional regulator